MASGSPKVISIRIAIILASALVLIYCAINRFDLDGQMTVVAAVIGLSTLVLSYLVVLYFLEKFLHQKVKVIYKTIHNFKRSEAIRSIEENLQGDALEEVSKDVQAWTSDKLGKIEQLESQENFRREFIGNLAHELKTPVFNIQGYVLTLLDGALDDREHNELFLKKAAKSVDRITALLDDLDAITRYEEGALQLDIETFDAVALVKEVYDMLEETAKNSGISLRFKNPNQRAVNVLGDKGRITQVFTNLLMNSIKYGTEGGFTEVRFYDIDENVLIEVKDNGMGMEAQHLSRVFERFYRVDKSRSRHIGGTGLGLAITKHILEAHGHNISVSSEPKKGSTFSFTLSKP